MRQFFNALLKGILTMLVLVALSCANIATVSAASADMDAGQIVFDLQQLESGMTMEELHCALQHLDVSRNIEQLKSIVQDLIAQRDDANPLGAESRLLENLHLHPGFLDVVSDINAVYDVIFAEGSLESLRYNDIIAAGYDPRFALMRELADIMDEAAATQNRLMGVEGFDTIFTSWGGPTLNRPTFCLRFACDKYLPLVDIVLDFVGIPECMLKIEQSGRAFALAVGTIIPYDMESEMRLISGDAWNVECYEPNAVINNRTLIIGDRLQLRWPVSGGTAVLPGTLGHPNNSNGMRAFTTNHSIVPIGANVRDGTGQYTGTISNRAFTQNPGVDVSLIRFNSGITISSFVPAINRNITSFMSATPDVNSVVWRIGGVTGCRSGRILHTSADLNFTFWDFVNQRPVNSRKTRMIRTNHTVQVGDSGSALIHMFSSINTGAVGTAVAGIGASAYFSAAPNYRHVT